MNIGGHRGSGWHKCGKAGSAVNSNRSDQVGTEKRLLSLEKKSEQAGLGVDMRVGVFASAREIRERGEGGRGNGKY